MSSETTHSTIKSSCVDAALAETRRLFRGSPAATDALDQFHQELEAAISTQDGLSQSVNPAVMIYTVGIDTSQMDVALAKAEELKQALAQLSSVPASVAVTS